MKPKQKSINERIAVEVLGWENLASAMWKLPDGWRRWTLPNWSSDLTLAMGLLEGKSWTISKSEKYPEFWVGVGNLTPIGVDVNPSLPEAICLAVLEYHQKNPKSPKKTKKSK